MAVVEVEELHMANGKRDQGFAVGPGERKLIIALLASGPPVKARDCGPLLLFVVCTVELHRRR
jgi:hypothetical protein